MNAPSRLRRLLVFPAVVLILGTVVWGIRAPGHSSRTPQPPDSPADCVARLLAAEERGDPRAYLECFAAEQRARLETRWQGRSPSDLASDLRRSFAGLVANATTELVQADDAHAALILERIHKDHSERQRVTLVRDDGRWKIVGLAEPVRQTPAIPYGTPIFARPE